MNSFFGAQDMLEIEQERYEESGVDPFNTLRTTFKEPKRKDYKYLFYIHQNVDSYHF